MTKRTRKPMVSTTKISAHHMALVSTHRAAIILQSIQKVAPAGRLSLSLQPVPHLKMFVRAVLSAYSCASEQRLDRKGCDMQCVAQVRSRPGVRCSQPKTVTAINCLEPRSFWPAFSACKDMAFDWMGKCVDKLAKTGNGSATLTWIGVSFSLRSAAWNACGHAGSQRGGRQECAVLYQRRVLNDK
jgi:hypothetical protein